jgi:hypothetical protein
MSDEDLRVEDDPEVIPPEWLEERRALRQAEANAAAVDDRLATALTNLRAFIDAPKPGTAALQASAAYDATKLCCRVLVGLIRLRLRRLDGTD